MVSNEKFLDLLLLFCFLEYVMICLIIVICFDSISECTVVRILDAKQSKVRGLGRKKLCQLISVIKRISVVQFLAQEYVKFKRIFLMIFFTEN